MAGVDQQPVRQHLHVAEADVAASGVGVCQQVFQLMGSLGIAVHAEPKFQHLTGGVLTDQPLRGAFGHDCPVVNDDEPVAQLFGLIHVVGGQHQSGAGLLQPEQPVPEHMPCLRIQPGGGLIQQQNVRFVDQCAGNRQPALHAPGKVLHPGAGSVAELSELQQLIGLGPEEAAGQSEVAAVHNDVLPDRELLVQVVLLGDHPQACPHFGALLLRIQAGHLHLARRACRHCGDHAHGGGLARPVGPQQAERLTPADAEADVVHGGEVSVALGQFPRVDGGGGCGARVHRGGRRGG